MKFRENEDAVSPVIGVILMVAITVILAAVIAAFVFGMGSNVGTTKTVAVTAGQNDKDIILTYHGGADADTLSYFKITTPEIDNWVYSNTTNDAKWILKEEYEAHDGSSQLPVGTTITLVDNGTDLRDHVVVVGHFMDGSEHVILDTYV